MSGPIEDYRQSEDASDDEQPPTVTAGPSEQRRLQALLFENWVSITASKGGFVREQAGARHNMEDESVRSLMARQEGTEIIRTPRDYQLELFERAKKENLIAVLDTGTGKTLIAVLLIRWVLDQEAEARATGKPSRVVFFLVPSVNLVLQQTAVLETNLAYAIGSYHGSLNVDNWSRETWLQIFNEHRVVVCTAEILRNCLDKSYIRMDQISLLVFDEAHHAKKDDPYAKIMRRHYHITNKTDRPLVFGMTVSTALALRLLYTDLIQASPVDAKTNVAHAASDLETLLDSRIVTTGDLTSLQSLRRPTETNVYYTAASSGHDSALARDISPRLEELPYLREHFEAAELIAQHLGTWCADLHVLQLLGTRAKAQLNILIEKGYVRSATAEETAQMDERRSQYHEVLSHMERHHSVIAPSPTSDLYTDKVAVLKRILDAEFEEATSDRCMVFVGRQVTAQLLAQLFERIGHENLRCGYLIGSGRTSLTESGQSFRDQVLTLTKFRNGKVNCLFVTSVAEEGLDIPLCNLVVRFDLYQTMIQYVQSRGRARQNNSKFIHMIAHDHPKQQQQRQIVHQQELQMRSWCSSLPDDRRLLNEDTQLQLLQSNGAGTGRTYVEPETGATLTYDNALSWLGHFVAVMPSDTNELQYPTNALLAVNTKCKDSYQMLTKPTLWKTERGKPIDKLYMVVVECPDGFEYEHTTLVMLTRSIMPEFPPFVIVRNDGQDSRVVSSTVAQPIEVDQEELRLLAAFTLRILRDVFSKTYADTVNDLTYFLAPHARVSTMIRSKSTLDWSLMRDVTAMDSDEWTPATDPCLLLNRFLMDRWDDSRRYISRSIDPELAPDSPVPEDAVRYKWHANVLDYSVSLFERSRANATWTASQPVIVAEKLNLRRNMLVPGTTKEMDLCKKAYICPEPFRISRLPTSVVVASLAWPSVIWRFESVLIALEACSFLGLDCQPSLALAAVTNNSEDSADKENPTRLHSGMGENYERLEFLGDCFLKLATTLAVFVNMPREDEFVSHVERMLMLCNKTLFDTSVALGIPKYIRSKPLSRRLWYPEGLQLVKGKGVNEKDDPYNNQKQGLAEKTIADVSEALIGAAFLSHNQPDRWHADYWKVAVKAVSKLVGKDAHTMQRWEDYGSAYEMPEYQSRTPTASQKEAASMIEKAHDYHFQSPTLLRSAFIHSSQPFTFEKIPSYERLEFLGDALLDMAIITDLFYRFPDKDEQWMSEAKTAMVSNKFFGALACKLGFHKHIRHNNSSIESAVRAYAIELAEKLSISGGSRDYWLHVSSPPKCLADLVEAYVGAMFIDSRFDYGQVQRFFQMHIKWHFEDMGLYEGYAREHPVTKLHHLMGEYGCRRMQVLNRPLPSLTRSDRKELVIAVMIHDKVVAHTTGTSVTYGDVRAASSALRQLEGLTRNEFVTTYNCNCGMDGQTVEVD
ncbi:hypothetical protein AMS68_005224 [Peltaster fructicola]|uniref:Dicer-like protein 1 n=1 Tax=Peltaster fructicola TaxID=286661 RepID=A0A6H0XY55_9PEZI|nr:hypothetical protein AMS68_005224 [Peltaster fructicola]